MGTGGTSDAFYFPNFKFSGDVDVRMRFDDYDGIQGSGGMAGLMLRNSLQPDAQFYSLMTTCVGSFCNLVTTLCRVSAGSSSINTVSRVGWTSSVGMWFRILKAGNSFKAFMSDDNESTWIDLARGGFDSSTIDFDSDSFHVGIAVSSGQGNTSSTLRASDFFVYGEDKKSLLAQDDGETETRC